MNEQTIAFICCVNNENHYNECKNHINHLYVPAGFRIEHIPLYNCENITVEYNKAMKNSKAKYKVYIHQDCFILNKTFIPNFLKVFSEDEQNGMLGVAGVKQLPPSGVWWEGKECYGKVIEYRQSYNYLCFQEFESQYVDVHAVDGLVVVTQYDIEWDERIKGFHFYDTSQCIRFIKQGLNVVIPRQPMPWVLHFIGKRGTNNQDFREFHQLRKKFLHLYGDTLKYI
ncbi:glycosyltransferase family protein [Chengkuizengella sediminis]|uniref:glycosyltransferase family protein n=1 Tax=Chengkuizengella sediminis TaxID=1885917 RepID=UPI00138A2A81|nr:glycosyltransferase family protein [Chengkuizengella sediminis]NDI36223.1 glycosyltransferase [Chengkuizengella sediminis]